MQLFLALLAVGALVWLGHWATRTQSVGQRSVLLLATPVLLAVVIFVAMISFGVPYNESLGKALAVGVLAFSTLSTVLSRWVWDRPWLLILVLPVALFFGFVIAVNIGLSLGLPH